MLCDLINRRGVCSWQAALGGLPPQGAAPELILCVIALSRPLPGFLASLTAYTFRIGTACYSDKAGVPSAVVDAGLP